MTLRFSQLVFFTLLLWLPRGAASPYFDITYAPGTNTGELAFSAAYTVWIPDSVKTLRGVIVHQHGCGASACKGGATAAYDLHWQALARKWDCALMGPSYGQKDGDNCRLWCDPRNGSEKTFLRSLTDLAAQSGHPELEKVPWCLWGHSGGGFWASLMQTLHPSRIIAIWFRSGTAYTAWEHGDISKPEIPAGALEIPMMCNPGVKEKGHERFNGAWAGTLAMFQAYRAKGAPIGFAPDPHTAHECGDSRYLAIRFFDACLSQRLPEKTTTDHKLKPLDTKKSWLTRVHGDQVFPRDKYTGNPNEAVWLPDGSFAKAWIEYTQNGYITDPTPPPAPFKVQAKLKASEGMELTWSAHGDIESGLAAFIIQKDGVTIATLPQKPVGKFGLPLFQTMSYHDTPELPLPEMRYLDASVKSGPLPQYQIISINAAGVKSQPGKCH